LFGSTPAGVSNKVMALSSPVPELKVKGEGFGSVAAVAVVEGTAFGPSIICSLKDANVASNGPTCHQQH
jgi:hypothetical protein